MRGQRPHRVLEAFWWRGRHSGADLSGAGTEVQNAGGNPRCRRGLDDSTNIDAKRRAGVVPGRQLESRTAPGADQRHLLGDCGGVCHGAADEACDGG